MISPRWPSWPLTLLLASGGAVAADEPAPAAPPAPPSESRWEGAIGPVVSYSPDYSGSSARSVSVSPGFYIRYGRLSISNAGGFVTRRNKDDIFRGLGLDVVRDERLRVNLGLRLDRGRKSADTKGLAGIDDVPQTLRARASVTRQLDRGWKVSGGLNADLLAHRGGNMLDFGISHDQQLTPDTTWNIGSGLTWADHRNLQSYYGVTASESMASGYPVYTPGSGFRDVSIGTSWRTEINPRWIALWGGSVGRLLGPAADSPLTTSTRQWSVNAAVAWRF
jgi:outer membrane protein